MDPRYLPVFGGFCWLFLGPLVVQLPGNWIGLIPILVIYLLLQAMFQMARLN